MGRGAWSPSNAVWPWPRPTSMSSFILIDLYRRLATTDMGRKRGPRSPFLARGTWVPSNTMSLGLGPTCLPSGILIDQDMWSQHGRKLGRLCPFRGGDQGPHLTQCGLAVVYFRTMWRLHPSSRLATIDMGRKLGAVPLLGGAATHLTQKSPRSRPISIPSGILVHPAIWTQRTLAENWGGGCAPLEEGSWVPI